MNLAKPALLFLWIALPIMAVAAVFLSRFNRKPWERLTSERLRNRLIRSDHPLPRWLVLGMVLTAMATFIFALARPQGDAGVKTDTAKARNVMIALDLSRSMRVNDVNPDRLGQAKIIGYEILDTLENDRVGLIGFAGSAHLFAPLTIDLGAMRETIEQIDEEWVPMGGSDLAAAIKLATQTLKETGQKNNLLIVLSDGEEHTGDLDAIIAEAESAGVKIFAIGVGTENGGFVPHNEYSDGFLLDGSGHKVLSRLEPNVLRKLATSTGGRFVVAGSSGDIPALIEEAVQGMDVFEMEAGERRVVIEFYQWAVLPGIIFLMAAVVSGTRWRKLSLVPLIGMMCFFSDQSQAGDLSDARKAFQEGRYGEARDTYHLLAGLESGDHAAKLRLAEGLSAYEATDLRSARSAYSKALLSGQKRVLAEAHEGMGNTLFQLGWVGISGSRYPSKGAQITMDDFDAMVREQIQKMSEEVLPESGDTNGYVRMEAIMINWADAIRHYRSALINDPTDRIPVNNEEMTLAYLKRLAELLKEEKEQTEKEMMQPLQEQGEPKEGEGNPQQNPKEGEEGEEKNDGNQGDKDKQDPNKGENGDENPEGTGDKGDEPKETEQGDDKNDPEDNPNESPEDKARRLLKENSDVEKGPLTRGRREFRNPDKDW